MKEIDLNCDVGEGLENESLLFPHISSCSIACGGHAGDDKTMNRVVILAMEMGIRIGAHPSYPDRENFGRKSLSIPERELMASINAQMERFAGILLKHKGKLHHIKAHGALYNDLAKDKALCETFLEAIKLYRNGVKLYVPFGSVLAEEAGKQGWLLAYEAFGDRNYNEDLSLVSRTNPDALIKEPEKVLEHIRHIIEEGKVKTLSGERIPIKADTICLHGDTPNVSKILMYLSRELPKRNISVI